MDRKGPPRKNAHDYAIYKGDEFVDVGTIRELCQRLNMPERTLRWHASKCNKRRAHKNGMILVRLEDD